MFAAIVVVYACCLYVCFVFGYVFGLYCLLFLLVCELSWWLCYVFVVFLCLLV